MSPFRRSREIATKKPEFEQSLRLQDGSWSTVIVHSSEKRSLVSVTQLFGYLPQRPLNGPFSIRRYEINWGWGQLNLNVTARIVSPLDGWQVRLIIHQAQTCYPEWSGNLWRQITTRMAAITVTERAWFWGPAECGSKRTRRPCWGKGRERKGPEKGKRKKSNKNSMSPPCWSQVPCFWEN